MRMRKKKNLDERLKACESIRTEAPYPKGRWNEVFGNENPIMLEIGCGKGGFITELAMRFPDINFIALEKCPNVLVLAMEKAKNLGIENIRYIGDNADILEEIVNPGEARRIYINFCDPWHKSKHFKRRLTYREYLEKYEKLLSPVKGEVHFKTDNRKLFEFSLNEIADMNYKMRNITLDLHNSKFEGNIVTEYEKQFSDMGFPIYRLEILF